MKLSLLAIALFLFHQTSAFAQKPMPSKKSRDCMARVIALDDSLGKARNHACERLDLSETIRQYAKGLSKINYKSCPAAFANAFKKHREAWLALIPVTDQYSALRGEMHDLFKKIESGKDGKQFKALVKTVWDTWAEIETAMADASLKEQPILVSPQWVHERLHDPTLVVIQINFLRLDYEREHIPGARFLWAEWITPNSPEGNFNVPDKKQATALLQKLGISKNSKIVLCHTRDQVTVTSRVFLTLEQLGLRGQVSFLNGGLEAWKNAKYPVTKEIPVVKKGNFKANPGKLIVDADYVLQSLRSDSSVVVDARMKRFYDGDVTGNPRDGHITGALNIPYPDMVDSTNLFKPLDQLESYFTPVVPDKKKEIVLYCFIGQTASVVYIAGRLLGYRMKLYDASLQEWSRRDELPMEKTKK
ncbi:MAG: sulfurtransferase [Saprospiraceae bacterium]|nr:sulfurtransferase [Saprospiraceae bacterium]